MAVTIGPISTFFSNSQWPWNYTSPATIDTSEASALLIFIANNGNNKPPPSLTYEGVAMELLGQTILPNGYFWVYGLASPVQTATGSFNLSNQTNGDPASYIVIPLIGTADEPFGATGEGTTREAGTLTDSLITTADESLIISSIMSMHGPAPSQWSHAGSSPEPIQLALETTNLDVVQKAVFQEGGPVESEIILSNKVDWNQHAIWMVEVLDGGAPRATLLEPPSIEAESSVLGNHLAKDPNVELLGPQSIEVPPSLLGSPKVIRQVLVYFDANPPAHTVTGSPPTTVERTSQDSAYRVSRASTPIVHGEKKYWEVTILAHTEGSVLSVGAGAVNIPLDNQLGGWQSNAISWDSAGGARHNNIGQNGRTPYTAGDVLMFAMDMVNGWLFMGQNGVWYNGLTSGNVNFDTGDGRANSSPWNTANGIYPAVQTQHIGDKLFANFGKHDFQYGPPEGFEAMDTGGPAAQQIEASSLPEQILLGLPSVENKRFRVAPESLLGASETGQPVSRYVAYHQSLESISAFGMPRTRVFLTAAGFENESFLGDATVHTTFVLSHEGVGNLTLLGAPKVIPAPWELSLSGIGNENLLGSFGVHYRVHIAAITSQNLFGNHLVAFDYNADSLYVPSISSPIQLGGLQVNHILHGSGFHNLSTLLGYPTLTSVSSLEPEGIAAPAQLGSIRLARLLTPAGIESLSLFGEGRADLLLHMPGIASGLELGTVKLIQRHLTIPAYIKVNGVWQSVDQIFVKYAGQWRAVATVYEKVDGSWQELR